MAPLLAALVNAADNRAPFKSPARSSQGRVQPGFSHPGTDFPCLVRGEPISSSLPPLRAPHQMRAILEIILLILDLYVWLLIASAILSWLIAFNVVNTRNQLVAAIAEFLYRITEPLLAPIRSIMPNLGGLDISPIILILLIYLIEKLIVYNVMPLVIGY
jgi:YggT family protein